MNTRVHSSLFVLAALSVAFAVYLRKSPSPAAQTADDRSSEHLSTPSTGDLLVSSADPDGSDATSATVAVTEAETSAPAFGGRIDLAALKSRSTPLFGGEDYQVYVDAAQAVGLSELDIRELERCLGDALRDFNWAERTLAEVRHTSETLSIVVPRFPDIGREIFQALSSQLESSFGAEVAGELLNFKKHGFYSPLQQLGLRRRTVEIQKRFTGEGTFYDYVSDWYVVHEFEGRSGDPTRIQDIKSLTHKVSNARRDVLMEAIPNFVGQVPGTF